MAGERNVEVTLQIPAKIVERARVVRIAGGALDLAGEVVEFRSIGNDSNGAGL